MDRVRHLDEYRRQKERQRRLREKRLQKMRRQALPPKPSRRPSLPAWAWLWIGLFAGIFGYHAVRTLFFP
ncbi:MAG: hypothetical protein QJR00_06680 [Bacillota bacterium]|nr:hypothetical protein [Bacillota bacterium]